MCVGTRACVRVCARVCVRERERGFPSPHIIVLAVRSLRSSVYDYVDFVKLL